MEKNTVKLNICGADYTITSEDSHDYVLSIGNDVDLKIKDIIEKNPKISITMASTLAALEYCDCSNKSCIKIDNLNSKINEYSSQISTLKSKNEIALSEVDSLKAKINELNLQISRADKVEIQIKKYAKDIVDLQNKYDITYLKLKEAENSMADLTSKNKNELDKLFLKNQHLKDEISSISQDYEDKINALKEELATKKLMEPLAEIVTHSDSKFEIVTPELVSF